MKRKLKIALIVFGAIIFIWIGYTGAVKYGNWKWRRGIEKEAAKFENTMKERENLITADTYGGKTPQETLAMFIAAVEKGDYELASKYFVVEKQEKELKDLREAKKESIDFLLKTMKEVQSSTGYFSTDNMLYTVESPVFVEFIKYPSNTWKIDEI